MSGKKIFEYPGEQIDVHWDGRLCIHIAECGHAEGELFVTVQHFAAAVDQKTSPSVTTAISMQVSGTTVQSVNQDRA